MASIPTVKATGLSSQRQLDALYSGTKIFTPETVHKATLSTGLTVEYALNATGSAGAPAADASPETQEDHVVLIMGFMQRKESWAGVIIMLFERFKNGTQKKPLKVLTLDNCGIGGTDVSWWRYTTSGMAQDVLALMDHVGWKTAHVVGVSMGGMISLELASAAPQRMRSLSLIVTTRGKGASDPRAKEPMRKSLFSRDENVVVENLMKTLYPDEFLARPMVGKEGVTMRDEISAYHLQMIKQRKAPASFFGLLGQFLAIKTHFVSDERLAEIAKAGFPVLVVGSMQDILIPPVESVTLMERMKAEHVQPLFFEDSGHAVTVQCVDEVADGLVNTFARASSL